jgi:hypothetical protein
MKESAVSRAADQGRADAAAALDRSHALEQPQVDLVAAERQAESEQAVQ